MYLNEQNDCCCSNLVLRLGIQLCCVLCTYRQIGHIDRTLEHKLSATPVQNLTYKSHLHLHHASSCGHTVHCEHTEKEIVQFHCNSDCPVGFLQILAQSRLSGGHMLPLDTQFADMQQWHQ